MPVLADKEVTPVLVTVTAPVDALTEIPVLAVNDDTPPDGSVCQVGAPDPLEVSTCPLVPAEVKAYALPVPYETPPAVGVAVAFVPPLATGNVPDT